MAIFIDGFSPKMFVHGKTTLLFFNPVAMCDYFL
jgi:hypothetical protein